MNIIDALLGEHAVLYALFDELDALADTAAELESLTRSVAPVAATLVSHARIEDELLFPELREALGPGGLVEVMSEEHQEIDRALQGVLRAVDLEAASGDLIQALDLAREHFEKEEQVLFGEARAALPAERCEELGARWAKLRRVGLG